MTVGIFKAMLTLLRSLSFSSVPPKSVPLFICPVPASLQNLKAATLSEKARNTAAVPFPMGEFQLSLLAPDVKGQLWGWQKAQLAAKQGLERWRTKRGETDKWQGYQNSRDLGGKGISSLGLQTG